GTTLGRPAYMPPEQVGASAALDGRSDVYSLGATLYHVLAGRPPFVGETLQVIAAVVTKVPDPPSRFAPGLPAALDAICLRCLEKDPALRYPSAAALVVDLERFLAGEGRAT